jgi:hypothetical protein
MGTRVGAVDVLINCSAKDQKDVVLLLVCLGKQLSEMETLQHYQEKMTGVKEQISDQQL